MIHVINNLCAFLQYEAFFTSLPPAMLLILPLLLFFVLLILYRKFLND